MKAIRLIKNILPNLRYFLIFQNQTQYPLHKSFIQPINQSTHKPFKMTSFRIRPRFQVTVPNTPTQVEEGFKIRLAQPACPCIGRVIPGHTVLKIPAESQHYWSPQLDLSIEPHEEGTLIRGLYGPNPSVWFMFAFGYGAVAILGMFIAIIGFSQVSLGNNAPVLWALPVLGGIAIGLYIASQIGQKLGAEQTFTLHHFFEETIHARVHIT